MIDFFSIFASAKSGVEDAKQCIAVKPEASFVERFVSVENFQGLNGVWGAFNDYDNASTLYERLKKIKYVSRGTTGGMGAFAKNTYQKMLDNGKILNMVSVVMAALDTDLGRYVIESTPEAMDALKEISNASSEDWAGLKEDMQKALELVKENPELILEAAKADEVTDPILMIFKSVFQGTINLLNPL